MAANFVFAGVIVLKVELGEVWRMGYLILEVDDDVRDSEEEGKKM